MAVERTVRTSHVRLHNVTDSSTLDAGNHLNSLHAGRMVHMGILVKGSVGMLVSEA